MTDFRRLSRVDQRNACKNDLFYNTCEVRQLVIACSIAVLTVLAVSRALAVVIMEPPFVRACTEEKNWPRLESCFVQHGLKAKVIRTIGTTRLVRTESQQALRDRDSGGLLVFVEKDHRLKLAGAWDPGDANYEVIAFEQLVRRGHAGYRIDVGESQPVTPNLNGTPVPGLRVRMHSVFCSAYNDRCTDAITTCETFVFGRALWSFHGTLALDDSSVHVNGDPSNSLPECFAPLQLMLGW
jgi:hypothetical protein